MKRLRKLFKRTPKHFYTLDEITTRQERLKGYNVNYEIILSERDAGRKHFIKNHS